MSKSLGNFFTIREVLAKYPAEVVRYLLTASHYRSQIDYSEDSLVEAQSGLERFYTALQDVPTFGVEGGVELTGEYVERFNAAMDDDFNSREALAVLFDMAREVNKRKRDDVNSASSLASQLKALGNIMGLLMQDPADFLRGEAADGDLSDAEIGDLMEQRNQAKVDRDFARADAIRDELKNQGVVLEDSREGTRWRREG